MNKDTPITVTINRNGKKIIRKIDANGKTVSEDVKEDNEQ